MGRCGAPWPGKLQKPLPTSSFLFAPFIALPHGRIGTRDLLLLLSPSLITAKRFEEKSPRSKKVRHYHIVATSGVGWGSFSSGWQNLDDWETSSNLSLWESNSFFHSTFSMTNFRKFSPAAPSPKCLVLTTSRLRCSSGTFKEAGECLF